MGRVRASGHAPAHLYTTTTQTQKNRNFYWDSAPSYSLLLVYPPLLLVFPEVNIVENRCMLLQWKTPPPTHPPAP